MNRSASPRNVTRTSAPSESSPVTLTDATVSARRSAGVSFCASTAAWTRFVTTPAEAELAHTATAEDDHKHHRDA